MGQINRQEVGVHVAGKVASFGVYLPGILAANGFAVNVRIIHRLDQFVPEIPPVSNSMTFQPGHPLGLWQGSFDLSQQPHAPGRFGEDGTYLYRFELLQNGQVVTRHFLDPFATGSGPAFLSSFVVGATPPFPWNDQDFRVPALDDLIVYELHVQEFNATFDGAIELLDYLAGLGVNCLELMPVNPVKRGFDWGYGPIGYFTPEESFGGIDGLKRLVNAAHQRGIAVILDVVFGHSAHDDFPYARVYDDAGLPNPMMQEHNTDPFGRGFDFTKAFTQEFFFEVTKHWINEYHVDGYRYDNVPGFYDGPVGVKYAKLVFETYGFSRDIARFQGNGFSKLIQMAEELEIPRQILRDTFSNSTWQDELLNKARQMAFFKFVDDDFVHLLDPGFENYPDTKDGAPIGDKPFPVAPVQYFDTHDHSRLIASFGEEPAAGPNDIRLGQRDLFYKLQPYAIALYTCRGVPLLFQGQEFAENYIIPDFGTSRIGIRRGVHFEYFYDDNGQPLVKLYRRLAKLRRGARALRSRDFFYFNDLSRPSDGVVVYRRRTPAADGQPEQTALVLLNFSERDATLSMPLPTAGVYRELLDASFRASPLDKQAPVGQRVELAVPSNYGQIFVSPPLDL